MAFYHVAFLPLMPPLLLADTLRYALIAPFHAAAAALTPRRLRYFARLMMLR